MLKRLRELWAAKRHTMAEIAEMLSTPARRLSRGSIAGMISRLGLTRERTGPRKKAVPTIAEAPAGKRRRERVRVPAAPPEPPRPHVPPGAWLIKGRVVYSRIPEVRSVPADGTPVPLLELGHGCKWPIAHQGGMHLFCNAPRLGAQYCEDHDRIAWSGRLTR